MRATRHQGTRLSTAGYIDTPSRYHHQNALNPECSGSRCEHPSPITHHSSPIALNLPGTVVEASAYVYAQRLLGDLEGEWDAEGFLKSDVLASYVENARLCGEEARRIGRG
jgi:hypothetical protein